jgi:hypothetical protein
LNAGQPGRFDASGLQAGLLRLQGGHECNDGVNGQGGRVDGVTVNTVSPGTIHSGKLDVRFRQVSIESSFNGHRCPRLYRYIATIMKIILSVTGEGEGGVRS